MHNFFEYYVNNPKLNKTKASKLEAFKFTCGIFNIAIGVVKDILTFIVFHIVILVEHFIYIWTIFANKTVLTIWDLKHSKLETRQADSDPIPLVSVQ